MPRRQTVITADVEVVGRWVHLAGVLTTDKKLRIYVDGELNASGTVSSLIPNNPYRPMEIGADRQAAVGDYASPFFFRGLIDDVKIYAGALPEEYISEHVREGRPHR